MSLFKNRKRSGMVLTGVVLSSGVVSAVNQGVAGAVPQSEVANGALLGNLANKGAKGPDWEYIIMGILGFVIVWAAIKYFVSSKKGQKRGQHPREKLSNKDLNNNNFVNNNNEIKEKIEEKNKVNEDIIIKIPIISSSEKMRENNNNDEVEKEEKSNDNDENNKNENDNNVEINEKIINNNEDNNNIINESNNGTTNTRVIGLKKDNTGGSNNSLENKEVIKQKKGKSDDISQSLSPEGKGFCNFVENTNKKYIRLLLVNKRNTDEIFMVKVPLNEAKEMTESDLERWELTQGKVYNDFVEMLACDTDSQWHMKSFGNRPVGYVDDDDKVHVFFKGKENETSVVVRARTCPTMIGVKKIWENKKLYGEDAGFFNADTDTDVSKLKFD